VDGIEQRDDRGFLLDGDLEDTETELALGYGRLLMNGALGLGGTVKLQRQSLAGYDGNGLGLDLGIWSRPLALAGARGAATRDLSLGLSIRNLVEPSIKLDQDNVPDPIAVRLGLAWDHDLSSNLAVLAAVDAERTRDMDARWHAGAELRIHRVLALRAGTNDGDLTAGIGAAWRGLGVDYQYEDNHLGDIHRFGLVVHFGTTVTEARAEAHARAEAEVQTRLASAFAAQNEAREDELVQRARRALELEHWEDALDVVGTLRVLSPDNRDLDDLALAAHRGLAGQFERQDDLAGAALSWRHALALAPGDPEALAGVARVQAERDRRSARSRALESRYEAALDAFASGDLLGARDGFAAVLVLAPDDRDAATMLARTEAAMTRSAAALAAEAVSLAEAGSFEQARARLARARALDPVAPGLAEAMTELDRLVAETTTGDRPAAPAPTMTAEATPRATTADPSLSPQRRQEIADLYARGIAAMEAGRRDEAVRYWEVVWAADPAFEQVREYLTREYLARGMEAYAGGALRRAVSSWEEALRVDPDDPRARGYLERARQQLSRMEKIHPAGQGDTR
jgi:tetratricopeptide (TPR) repeat protein